MLKLLLPFAALIIAAAPPPVAVEPSLIAPPAVNNNKNITLAYNTAIKNRSANVSKFYPASTYSEYRVRSVDGPAGLRRVGEGALRRFERFKFGEQISKMAEKNHD